MIARGKKQFEIACKTAAAAADLDPEDDLSFYDDGGRGNEFEDDGSLHVKRYGVRAVFDVSNGHQDSGVTQNFKTRAVLKALDIPVTDQVLTDEHDDDEDGCTC